MLGMGRQQQMLTLNHSQHKLNGPDEFAQDFPEMKNQKVFAC